MLLTYPFLKYELQQWHFIPHFPSFKNHNRPNYVYISMNKALIYKTTTNLCCDKMKCFKIPKNFSQSSAAPQNGFKIFGDKLILALKKSYERTYKLLSL